MKSINNQVKFNSEAECIKDYLKDLTVNESQLETWYNNYKGKRHFCIRIAGTKFSDSLQLYTMTKTNKYIKY